MNKLNILRDTSVGMFLGGKGIDDVLLPNRYVPIDKRVGDEIDVFIYLDSEDRPVACTDLPYVMCDEYASLEVKDVNRVGAFLDWGLEKDLLLPFNEQNKRLKPRERVFVKVVLDEVTNRLIATMRWKKWLRDDQPILAPWEEVDAIISSKTDLGYNVIVNDKHMGLVYQNEIFKPIRTGDKLKAYVKKVREDYKIDLQLEKPGASGIEPNAQKLMDLLKENDGYLGIHDKSAPEEIKLQARMSKKTFKKAVGALYKQRLITLEKDGIRLV